MDGRDDEENPPDERLEGVVEGLFEDEKPPLFDGRLDVPADGRFDEESPFDGRFDVPADGRFADPLPYPPLALLLATVLDVFLLFLRWLTWFLLPLLMITTLN